MRDIRRIHDARAACIACGAALFWSAGSAFATEPTPTTQAAPIGQVAPTNRSMHADHPAPTREQREKMAAAHEKIAACLRSDRPIDECHAEMMKMHEAMMHHMHAMKDHPATEPAQK